LDEHDPVGYRNSIDRNHRTHEEQKIEGQWDYCMRGVTARVDKERQETTRRKGRKVLSGYSLVEDSTATLQKSGPGFIPVKFLPGNNQVNL